MTKAKSTFH